MFEGADTEIEASTDGDTVLLGDVLLSIFSDVGCTTSTNGPLLVVFVTLSCRPGFASVVLSLRETCGKKSTSMCLALKRLQERQNQNRNKAKICISGMITVQGLFLKEIMTRIGQAPLLFMWLHFRQLLVAM